MAGGDMEKRSFWRKVFLDVDLDLLINPFVPRNHLDVLPKPINRWLGYRAEKVEDPPALARFPIVFLATVAGLCLVGGLYTTAPGIADLKPPALFASLGASAILDYNSIYSPLSQPRNTIVGHTLAAVIGVGISKLFQLSDDFASLQWVSAAIACACCSIAMSATNCLHPPGGATAVLASIDTQILELGWWFPPLILLASTLMTLVACIFNNIARQYPLYWWTSAETGNFIYPAFPRQDDEEQDEASEKPSRISDSDAERGSGYFHDGTSDGSTRTLQAAYSHQEGALGGSWLAPSWSLRMQLPLGMDMTDEEHAVLERLDQRALRFHPAKI